MDRHAHPVTYTDRAVRALKRPRAPESARESRCLTATIAPSCMHGGYHRVGYDEEACSIACEHAPARPGGREQFSCARAPSAAAPRSVCESRDRNRARGRARARSLHHRHGERMLSRAQTNSGSIGERGGAHCLSTDQPRHLGVCTRASAGAGGRMQTVRGNAVLGSNRDRDHLGACAGEGAAQRTGQMRRRGGRQRSRTGCGTRGHWAASGEGEQTSGAIGHHRRYCCLPGALSRQL